jgi:hypothetical protein
LLSLFEIKHDSIEGKKIIEHLTKVFLDNKENLSNVINNSDFKNTIWRLVMTDINLVIYKYKHCNKEDPVNYLGEDFCKYWDEIFAHTLSTTQISSIVGEITRIQPGVQHKDIVKTLLQLFNNKLEALKSVNHERLWGEKDVKVEVVADKPAEAGGPGAEKVVEPAPGVVAPGAVAPVAGAVAPVAGPVGQKYLKYKTKYLKLKNSVMY